MKKALARALSLLVCFVMLFSSAIPVLADGTSASTNVSITIDAFKITSKTEDFVIAVGGDETLTVSTSEAVSTYKWEKSTDGGTSWTELANTATYDITGAVANTPANVAYQYRITVTNATGSTDSEIIRVLVSDEYGYRRIALRNGNTEVSSYMHDSTRLVVTPLSDSATAAIALEAELPDGRLPLIICDVSLVNQNNTVVPYFGTIQVDFHVGSEYDGETLNVYHLTGGNVITYSGVVGDVDSGVLSIFVNSLSPFLVEIPATGAHTVTVSHGTGGTVAPSGKVNTPDGSDKTFTFLPDAGYEIDAVTVDGLPVTVTGNTYTLEYITQNHTVSVSFRAVTPSEDIHTITINSPAHGSIYPSGDITVLHGSAQTVYFYPDAGYELDTVTVNGTEVNVIGNSYTVSAVTADIDIRVSFRSGATQPPNIRKTISSSAGANGSISPMGDISVEYGGEMYFYFIPNAGYMVDKVKVDNIEVAVSGNFYRFVNVIGDHTINVTFKAIPAPPTYYTVNAIAGANGSISPSGDSSILKNGSQTFTFIPSSGYEIDTVTVDGAPVSVSGNAYTFTNVTANHIINVTFKRIIVPPTYYTVTATAGANGSISPSGDSSILKNTSQTFVFMPDTGYEVDTVTVDGATVSITGNAYTFTNITANHTINVTFKKIITITASAGANGQITPVGAVQVAENTSKTFTFTPNTGYEIDTVTVDGAPVSVTGNAYTFTNVTANHTINVTFKKIITITASAGANGQITPTGAVRVAENASQTFVFMPDTGYEVDTVTVDGAPLSVSGNAYTFTNVTANHTVNVTFKRIIVPPTYYTVTATASTNGQITPSGGVQVIKNGSQTFMFTPSSGYEIDSVTVDGAPVSVSGNTYTLTNVTANHIINVTFKKIITITASAGANGQITPTGAVRVAENGSKTFTFIPSSGYEIDTVTVDGTPVSVTGNAYTFTNVTANHTVNVTFKQIIIPPTYYTVTATASTNGQITPSGGVQVIKNGSQTFVFTPDSGYAINSVTVDGTPVSVTDSTYTFTNVTAAHTINVTYKRIILPPQPITYYTITATAGENGQITPSGGVKVAENGSQTFVITHDADYAIYTVTVDGEPVSVYGGAYTFADVKANHTINVTFKKLLTPPPQTTYYTITASAGENGQITPSGGVQVAENDPQTFVFVPEAGYEIDTVTVDGATVTVTSGAYAFADVTADHSINVTFKQTVIPPPPTTYYTITASAGENGSISPVGDVIIAEGRDSYFYFIPNEGYEVDTVTVDGVITAVTENSYRFEGADANHSIQVTFKKTPAAPVFHTVTVSAGSNGSVSPYGTLQIADGGSQTFSLTADEGYEIDTISVNGEKQALTGTHFTIDAITADMQLNVTFKAVSTPVIVDAEHCFICGWFGQNIAPWCWLAPLVIVALVNGVVFLIIKRRR